MKLNLALIALTCTQASYVDAKMGRSLVKTKLETRSSSMKRLKRRKSEGQLWLHSGINNPKEDSGKECDPKSNDLDLGFLPCGQGYVCTRNETSSLGGVCSPTGISKSADDRSLQGYCPTVGYNTNSCNCSNYVQGVGGSITDCLYLSNYCIGLEGYSGATELCVDVTYDAQLRPPLIRQSESNCYILKTPYTREACVQYTNNAVGEPIGCDIVIDGVTCNSCTLTTCNYASNENLIFDCTNTVAGSSGSTCNDEFPLPIFNFLEDYDGGGSPTTPSPFDASPVSFAPIPSPSPLSFAPIPVSFSSPTSSPAIFPGGCPTSENFNRYGCDCSNYVEGVGGSITDCLQLSEYCIGLEGYPGGTQVCVDVTYDLQLRPSLVRQAETYCYSLSFPYTRDFCIQYSNNDAGAPIGCDIVIDGVPCNSCTLTTCGYSSNDYLLWDCTNTVVGISGSECNDEFPLPIFNFLADNEEDGQPTTPFPVDVSPTISFAPVPVSVSSPTSSPTFSVADTTLPPVVGTVPMPSAGTSLPTPMTLPAVVTSQPSPNGMPTVATTSPNINGMPTVATASPDMMSSSTGMPAASTPAPTLFVTSSAASTPSGFFVLTIGAMFLLN